jgi:hypothetical protein
MPRSHAVTCTLIALLLALLIGILIGRASVTHVPKGMNCRFWGDQGVTCYTPPPR